MEKPRNLKTEGLIIMTNQRKETQARRLGFFKLATVAIALVALICCFTVLASAVLVPEFAISEHFNINLDYSNGMPVKEYDGTTDAPVTLTNEGKAALEAILEAGDRDLVKFEVTAAYNSANVKDATSITVTFTAVPNGTGADAVNAAAKYANFVPAPQVIPAKIVPQTLTWDYTNGVPSNTVQYVMGQAEYNATIQTAGLPALRDASGAVVTVEFADSEFVATATGVKASLAEESYTATVRVALKDSNYVAAPLNVGFKVQPIEIVRVVWQDYDQLGQYSFAWGDAKAFGLVAIGLDADNNQYPLNVVYPDNYGNAGVYTDVRAVAVPGLKLASNVTPSVSVTIQKRMFIVSMSDATYFGNADTQTVPTKYSLTVDGDLPANVRELILYVNNDMSAYGVYAVDAILPTSENYYFCNTKGETVTGLSATLTVKKSFLVATNEELPYQAIIYRPAGFLDDVSATVTVPTDIDSAALKSFPYYKAYTVTINGAANDKFTVTIPFSSDLFQENCQALSVNDLYVYDPITGVLYAATELNGYTVTVGDSYYQIEGVAGDTSTTFVLAPVYEAPFWGSVWSILLIILLVIALIALMMLIGLYLLRVRVTDTEETVIDDEGEAPAVETPEVEDKVDVEETIEEKLEDLAQTVEPAAEEEAAEEDVADVVAETIQENFNESADATEAIALVEEEAKEVEDAEDNDDADDEDDDEESFGGFGNMPLDFIDAIAEADKYAVMLEEESRGEVRLVTRYRRSFQSRLSQSQGNVQEYYNAIKNLLLSYKGVKSRISWNYDAFNRGRSHVAKINVKTKTLYLYLALNPEELADTKYGVIDMSSKKKYATVPVLMKIKGDRKFKYALELIAKLCGEDLELQQREGEEVDYKLAYQTTEELVQAGLVKKLVASIPVVYSEAPVLEEAAEPVTPATEDQEVSFVAPTDDAAVAAAAEEIASEEAENQ